MPLVLCPGFTRSALAVFGSWVKLLSMEFNCNLSCSRAYFIVLKCIFGVPSGVTELVSQFSRVDPIAAILSIVVGKKNLEI